MTATLRIDALAHLCHEYRTPVNHIIGYSELLIEDAGERHLESLVPSFQRIRDGGRELLESIQRGMNRYLGAVDETEISGFRASIHPAVEAAARNLGALVQEMARAQRETLTDLDVISHAVERLFQLTSSASSLSLPANEKTSVAVLRAALHSVPGNDSLSLQKKGRGRILIADDDAANRYLLRRALELEGHEVLEAANGLEVIDAIGNSPCDLVLMDLLMPVLDGFQTLQRMKQDTRLRELPVIMVSALDDLQGVVRCIETGAEDYVSKPFNQVLLRARIGASLEKKWLRDSEHQRTAELEESLRLLEQVREQLALQASRDPLTGLANRRSLDAHLDSRVRSGTPFTVIYIDLNGFKKINDTLGHAAGDDLLTQVADRLCHAFRSVDVIGRWGGDEFVALVDETAGDVQVRVARVTECLAADFLVGHAVPKHRAAVGAAVGVASWKPGDTANDVIQRADLAMYEARQGRRLALTDRGRSAPLRDASLIPELV